MTDCRLLCIQQITYLCPLAETKCILIQHQNLLKYGDGQEVQPPILSTTLKVANFCAFKDIQTMGCPFSLMKQKLFLDLWRTGHSYFFSYKSQNAVSSSSFESCDKEELIQIISSISNSLDILGKKIIGENKIPGIGSTPIISRPFDANASNGDSPSQKDKLASDAK